MARFLIVGFGNPLRSDDGVGWYVAQQLQREVSREDVLVIPTQQLTPEMAEAASQSGKLLFIDAAHGGLPGTISCQEVQPTAAPRRFTHELSPASLLQLALELYGRAPAADLLTIAGECFEMGDGMSEPVRWAIPGLIARIKEIIA